MKIAPIVFLIALFPMVSGAEQVRFELTAECRYEECSWAGLTPPSSVTGLLVFDRNLLPDFDTPSTTAFKASQLIDFSYIFGQYSFNLADVLPEADIVIEISPGGVPMLISATSGGNVLAVRLDDVQIGFDSAFNYQSSRVNLDTPEYSLSAFNYTGMWIGTVVPIPAAVWLFGSSLGLLGWLHRRQAAKFTLAQFRESRPRG